MSDRITDGVIAGYVHEMSGRHPDHDEAFEGDAHEESVAEETEKDTP